MKYKSLIECWLTPHRKTVENADADKNPHLKVIQRNVHDRLEICEGKGTTAKKSVDNYRVHAIHTKTYSKWFLCDKGEQAWKKGIDKDEYRVLARMIQFVDHLMGKYKDVKPARYGKWGRMSMYVLYEARHIVDVVQKLDMNYIWFVSGWVYHNNIV